MFTIQRDLILLQNAGSDNELHKELFAHQWNVHVARDLREASNLFESYQYKVGICLIDKPNDKKFLEHVRALFVTYTSTNWIIGLPQECKPDKFSPTLESQLIAEYCYDYLVLPVGIERLLFTVGHAYGMAEITLPPNKGATGYSAQFGLIGNSPAMLNLFKLIDKASKEDYAVLIEGETGTGKELIAKAVHDHSRRATKPFIAVNCGAFPQDLIQAELFGYEKGAFTGAQQRKIGRIEAAQGGTLFLDEIGDLPYVQQVNLLRFLEEKTIERIGGLEKIPVDVRIIAATHVDLKTAVQEGKFRQDLYYRLRVLQLKVPPLRARESDIELLAWHFFNKFSANRRYKSKGFSVDALHILRNYDWPGNVRELMNYISHAVVMSDNRLLTPADLGLERRYKERGSKTLEEARAYADRESIISSLQQSNYNMSRAAEMLGISRVSLYRLIDKYQLKI